MTLLSAGMCKLIHKTARKIELIYVSNLKAGTFMFLCGTFIFQYAT